MYNGKIKGNEFGSLHGYYYLCRDNFGRQIS